MAANTSSSTASHGRRYRLTFVALAFGTLAYCLLQSLVLPALPSLQRDLHTSESTVAWLLTAFLLSASVATPIVGRLGDMFGKEKLLVVVFATLAAGCLLGALSTSVTVMIVARVVQGTAGAVFPLSFGIIRDEFPEDKVAGGVGLISTILGGGSALGIVLGGPIVQHVGYAWLYWIPMAMALVAGAATVAFIPESPVRTRGRVNVPAAACLTGWLLALLVGVSEGPTWGWGSPKVLALVGMSVVLFGLWVASEARSDHPLVDMRMMRIPAVWWTNIAAFVFGVGMYSSIVLIPPFLQTPPRAGYGFGVSPTVSGLYMVPSAIGMFVMGLLIGRLTARFGAKTLLVTGSLLSVAPFALLAISSAAPWEFLFATTVSGLGMGLGYASLSNLIVESVPETQTGVATGMNANIRTIGGAVGTQVVASIVASGVVGRALPHERGYAIGFALLAVAFVAATLAAVAIPRRVAAPATSGQLRGAGEPLAVAAPMAGGHGLDGAVPAEVRLEARG